jgi:3-oxoacyl-[acyl-carrier protein] reductase
MTFKISLEKRRSLVTGGSTGIGRACVLALAEAGADIVFTYLKSSGPAENLVEQARSMGAKAYAVRCDVTSLNDVKSLREEVVKELGGIDIIVNNAGAAIRRTPFLDAGDELWESSFQLNMMGMVRICREFIPIMAEEGFGRIINITSLAGTNGGIADSIHYASMKGAANTFTLGLANELASKGITVNAIAPGIVDTPFQEKTPGINLEKAKQLIPAGRVGIPEDIAPMVVYLASGIASFITGEIYHIDGGRR